MAEPRRHAGRNFLVGLGHGGGSLKERVVTCAAVASGEQGEPRGAAGRGLDVVALEEATAGGESIDMGGLDVVDAVAAEFGTKVVDADEENGWVAIGAQERLKGKAEGEAGEENQSE